MLLAQRQKHTSHIENDNYEHQEDLGTDMEGEEDDDVSINTKWNEFLALGDKFRQEDFPPSSPMKTPRKPKDRYVRHGCESPEDTVRHFNIPLFTLDIYRVYPDTSDVLILRSGALLANT